MLIAYIHTKLHNHIAEGEIMEHTLPELPYGYDALEPFIDTATMEIHHTKHHQAYINNLNEAIRGNKALKTLTVEQLISHLEEIPESIRTTVRNHGGGHANHRFFWTLLKKDVRPKGPVLQAINKRFGDLDAFRDQFTKAAGSHFGSGWAWLVVSNGNLEIMTTANQDSPLSLGKKPILGIDVWEHAYYLLYQNRRPEYVKAFFNVINWETVNELFIEAAA